VELDFYMVSFNTLANMQFLRFGGVRLDIDLASKEPLINGIAIAGAPAFV
jgi:hypothetical protein